MKMKLMGYLMFAFLSVLTLSYGMSGAAFAANSFVTVSVPESTGGVYGSGDRVVLSGTIEDYDAKFGYDITYRIYSPSDSIVHLGQLSASEISADGSFELDFIAEEPLWKVAGDYNIIVNLGPASGKATINYVGGEQPPPPPEPPVVEPPPPEPPVVEPPPPEPPVVDPTPPPADKDDEFECGEGTRMVNGRCEVIPPPPPTDDDTGGGTCLIATAAYGTELAPQIQLLREVRDNTVLSTASGSAFMTGFNALYYSFAPTIADWERESPLFKESVKAFITPMVSTLSIMTLADTGSEAEVLGYGLSVIALNLAMYIAAPALIAFRVHQHLKSKK